MPRKSLRKNNADVNAQILGISFVAFVLMMLMVCVCKSEKYEWRTLEPEDHFFEDKYDLGDEMGDDYVDVDICKTLCDNTAYCNGVQHYPTHGGQNGPLCRPFNFRSGVEPYKLRPTSNTSGLQTYYKMPEAGDAMIQLPDHDRRDCNDDECYMKGEDGLYPDMRADSKPWFTGEQWTQETCQRKCDDFGDKCNAYQYYPPGSHVETNGQTACRMVKAVGKSTEKSHTNDMNTYYKTGSAILPMNGYNPPIISSSNN
jgi:hypothetical protein